MHDQVALVVGGTGMLAGLTAKLASEYKIVGVIGRTDGKLQLLAKQAENIVPIKSDYTDLDSFEESIKNFVHEYGKPALVVSWIHSGSDAPLLVANYCMADFYEVTGSSGREASDISHTHETKIAAKGINYHRVVLGSIGNRWLTNQEVSEGVYEAIHKAQAEYLVGE